MITQSLELLSLLVEFLKSLDVILGGNGGSSGELVTTTSNFSGSSALSLPDSSYESSDIFLNARLESIRTTDCRTKIRNGKKQRRLRMQSSVSIREYCC